VHVLLIHGLGRTPLSLALLGWRMSRQGYVVRYFGYASFYESFERIVARLVATLQPIVCDAPYALVGHSLGGLIARAALPALAELPPRHLVMLAPPNQSPLLARRLRNQPLYRLATGGSGRKLADPAFYQRLQVPAIPTTIIAGTAGPRGRFSPFGELLNDGVVSVEETQMGPVSEVVLVPSVHTFIMNSPQVARLIGERLARS
jgi:pimeloyl-ACP methyl ester carboxylesterase